MTFYRTKTILVLMMDKSGVLASHLAAGWEADVTKGRAVARGQLRLKRRVTYP